MSGRAAAWRAAGVIHDASLLAWGALAVARACGLGRAGAVDAAVVAVNLAAGTPAALRRMRERRRDPVALAAPVAVAAAVLATARRPGGRAPALATAVLGVLTAADRRITRNP